MVMNRKYVKILMTSLCLSSIALANVKSITAIESTPSSRSSKVMTYTEALKVYNAEKAKYELDKAAYENDLASYNADKVKDELDKKAYEEALSKYKTDKTKYDLDKKTYEDAVARYKADKSKYDSDKKIYEAAVTKYKDDKSKYDADKKAYEDALAEYRTNKDKYDADKKVYEDSLAKYEADKKAYEEAQAKHTAAKELYERELISYNNDEAENKKRLEEYEKALKDYNDKVAAYETSKAEYDKAIADNKVAMDKYKEDMAAYEAAKAEYEKKLASNKETIDKYESDLTEYERQKAESEAAKAEYDRLKAIWDVKKAQYDKDKTAYDTEQDEYKAAKAEYDKKLDEYNKAVKAREDQIEANKEADRVENARRRAEYEAKLKEIEEESKKPGRFLADKVNALSFASEPNARANVNIGQDGALALFKPANGRGAVYEWSDHLDKLSSDQLDDASLERNRLKNSVYKSWDSSLYTDANTGSGFVHTYNIIAKKNEPFKVTYTNIENSTYDGKKIGKIEYIYEVIETGSDADTMVVAVADDPTISVWIYGKYSSDHHRTRVKMTPIFYDTSGNKIIPSEDKPIYLGMGSMNANISTFDSRNAWYFEGKDLFSELMGFSFDRSLHVQSRFFDKYGVRWEDRNNNGFFNTVKAEWDGPNGLAKQYWNEWGEVIAPFSSKLREYMSARYGSENSSQWPSQYREIVYNISNAKFIKLNNSFVDKHPDGYYSATGVDSIPGWDNPKSPNQYLGAGVIKVTEDNFSFEFGATVPKTQRFALNTTIADLYIKAKTELKLVETPEPPRPVPPTEPPLPKLAEPTPPEAEPQDPGKFTDEKPHRPELEEPKEPKKPGEPELTEPTPPTEPENKPAEVEKIKREKPVEPKYDGPDKPEPPKDPNLKEPVPPTDPNLKEPTPPEDPNLKEPTPPEDPNLKEPTPPTEPKYKNPVPPTEPNLTEPKMPKNYKLEVEYQNIKKPKKIVEAKPLPNTGSTDNSQSQKVGLFMTLSSLISGSALFYFARRKQNN